MTPMTMSLSASKSAGSSMSFAAVPSPWASLSETTARFESRRSSSPATFFPYSSSVRSLASSASLPSRPSTTSESFCAAACRESRVRSTFARASVSVSSIGSTPSPPSALARIASSRPTDVSSLRPRSSSLSSRGTGPLPLPIDSAAVRSASSVPWISRVTLLPGSTSLVSSPSSPSPRSMRPRIEVSCAEIVSTFCIRSSPEETRASTSVTAAAAISPPSGSIGAPGDPEVISRYLSPSSPRVRMRASESSRNLCSKRASMAMWTSSWCSSMSTGRTIFSTWPTLTPLNCTWAPVCRLLTSLKRAV